MDIDPAELALFCGRAFVVRVYGTPAGVLSPGDEFSPKYGGGRYRFERITGNPESKYQARVEITDLETQEIKRVDPVQIQMTLSAFVDGTHVSEQPHGGDAIRLASTWRWAGDLVDVGDIGVLGGFSDRESDGGSVTFKPSTHRDRVSHAVSCSGGPGTIHTEAREFRPTEESTVLRVWDWGNNSPGADQGVDYLVRVRLWDWFPVN